MISNKFLDFLMESPLVYYIYNRGSIIYDLRKPNADIDFLVICDSRFSVPDEYKAYQKPKWVTNHTGTVLFDNCDFVFKSIDDWFAKVLNCDIDAWECACLPKKFIYKEHVKLLMTTDSLKLRNNLDSILELYECVATQYLADEKYYECKKTLWKIIKDYVFANQILENHKIVNFHEANDIYEKLVNNDCEEDFTILKYWYTLLKPHKERFDKQTDGVLRNSKLKKIIQD